MTTLEQKAAQSDGKSTCGTDCPLFYHCRHVGDPDSLAVKIAQLCSDKFREGYRKGYNQRKKEERNDNTGLRQRGGSAR